MSKNTAVWRLARTGAILITGFCSAREAFADHIVLTNSDSLTGTIASVSKTELAMDTALAGRVTLKWSAVSRIASTTSVRATVSAGVTVEGVPVISDGR